MKEKVLRNIVILLLLFGIPVIIYVAHTYRLHTPLVVSSGSMEPSIPVGSLIFPVSFKPLLDPDGISMPLYGVRDVIVFHEPSKNTLVSHRVINRYEKAGNVFYKMKGDANSMPDSTLISQNNVAGRVLFFVPYIGYAAYFAKKPYGFILMILLPSFMLIFSEINVIVGELSKRKKIVSGLSPQLVVPVLAVLFLGLQFSHSVTAFFSSNAGNNNNVLGAEQVFPTPTPEIADHLVINEVLYRTNCTNPQNKQWLELWNGSGSSVDLKDWNLRDQDGNTIHIVNSNTMLASGQFALLSKSSATWSSDCYGELLPDVVQVNLGGTINIGTSSGTIKLLDNSLNVIDRVDYGTSSGLITGDNRSIERKVLGQDSASGDTFNASDFQVREPATAGFAIPQNQQVVLNEFLVQPATGSADWIEVYNKSGSPVNVSGWALRDTTGFFFTFPPSTTISPGSFFVPPDFSNRLNNGGDKIYLYTATTSGTLVDGISYFKHVPSPGSSIGRTTDGVAAWSVFSTPTKNATNNTSSPSPLP